MVLTYSTLWDYIIKDLDKLSWYRVVSHVRHRNALVVETLVTARNSTAIQDAPWEYIPRGHILLGIMLAPVYGPDPEPQPRVKPGPTPNLKPANVGGKDYNWEELADLIGCKVSTVIARYRSAVSLYGQGKVLSTHLQTRPRRGPVRSW